ncbi:protease inhibitor 1 [Pogona vitticeps]
MKSGSLFLLAGLLTFWALLTVISGQPEICRLPPDVGPCKAYVKRYFYNVTSHKCELFIYGGCQGNQNNFESLEKCQDKCAGKPGICPTPPPDTSTTCDVRCANDWGCPEKQKCCHYGCSIACMPPI